MNFDKKIEFVKTIVNTFDYSNTSLLIDHLGYERTSECKHVVASNRYALHFIVNGEIQLKYKENTVHLSKNSFFLLFPTKKMEYIATKGTTLTQFWICLTGSVLLSFFKNIGFTESTPYYTVSENTAVKVKRLLKKALSLTGDSISSYLYLNEAFYRISKYIYQENANNLEKEENGQSPTIKKALLYINNNFNSPDLTLDKIAQSLFINPSYLSYLFKQEVGISFRAFIIQKRIHFADVLIRDGETNVGTIASLSGFNDVAYFSNVYKKTNGLSPSQEIAKQNKNKNKKS